MVYMSGRHRWGRLNLQGINRINISPEDLWVREMVQGLKRVAMVCAQK